MPQAPHWRTPPPDYVQRIDQQQEPPPYNGIREISDGAESYNHARCAERQYEQTCHSLHTNLHVIPFCAYRRSFPDAAAPAGPLILEPSCVALMRAVTLPEFKPSVADELNPGTGPLQSVDRQHGW